MAATISSSPSNASHKLELILKLEGHLDVVNDAIIIRDEDGVISISEDKTLRIWLKRETGSYWPSVCHYLPSAASAMYFHQPTLRLFVGMENGSISEFDVSDDYNKVTHKKNYIAHQGRVTGLRFNTNENWLISVGRDKLFTWHDAPSGRRLGGTNLGSSCSTLEFDQEGRMAFVGDVNGNIVMLKIEGQSNVKHATTMTGHTPTVKTLTWDPSTQMLFSGSYGKIVCWDIGGLRGTTYELEGHRGAVSSLIYFKGNKRLFSGGEDSNFISWDMSAKRKPNPNWEESDFCQRCSRPFFWNFKAMVDQKTIGLRQHHCRKCGKAICDSCSSNRTIIPLIGHETNVRVCDECHSAMTDADRASLAVFYSAKHPIISMDLDENRNQLLTTGGDRLIKLWDVTNLLLTPSSS